MSARPHFLILAVATAVAASPAFAQTPSHEVTAGFVARQWTIEDGLSGNTVRDILQTHDGYLWLATGNGLARFDGLRFASFSTANVPELPNNRFSALYQSSKGAIWALTEQSHVIRYDGDAFEALTAGGSDRLSTAYKEPGHARIYQYEDRLWVASDQGLLEYVDGKLEPFRPEEIQARVWVIRGDGRGTIWLGTFHGEVFAVPIDGGPIRRFATADGLPEARVHDLHLGPDGTLSVATRDGVYVQQPGGHFDPLTDAGHLWFANVRCIFEDTRGRTFYATAAHPSDDFLEASGWYTRQGGRMVRLKSDDPGELPFGARLHAGPNGQLWRFQGRTVFRGDEKVLRTASKVLSLTLDADGNVWVGTEAHGLFRVRPAVFEVFSEPEGLPSRRVESVMEDRFGTVWVGTEDGLATIDHGVVVPFDLQNGYRDLEPTYFPSKSYSRIRSPGHVVWGLLEDPGGAVWVGTNYEPCKVVGNQCVLPNLAGIHPDELENVAAMLVDSQGRFWIGSKWGLVLGRNLESSPVWIRYSTETGLTKNWIRTILETRDGTLLFGTYGGGILRYMDGTFEALTSETGLPSDDILTLTEDAEGAVWVGTEDRGLCRLRLMNGGLAGSTAECVSTAEGLFDNTIFAVIEDDADRLWMNSGRGIFWVKKSELEGLFRGNRSTIRSVGYTEEDGLRNRQGNGGVQPAATRGADGRLWFATHDGVAVVDPTSIVQETHIFPVVIESVRIAGKPASSRTAVTLQAGREALSVSFTAPDFSRPENISFRYRLEGFEAAWNMAGPDRSATYTNIPPGEYTLRVSASRGDTWGQGASVLVTKLPFFWQTRWFAAVALLLSALAILGIIRFNLNRLRTRNRALEELVSQRTKRVQEQNTILEEQATQLRRVGEMKSRFLANISHEFRTPLTLALGPLDDLRQGRHGVLPEEATREVGRIRRNASRLLVLINQLLDLSTLDAGALFLHPQRQDIVAFLRLITALFESMAVRDSIGLQFHADPERLDLNFDPDKLEKVVVNLLANAFKFTPRGGFVSVRVAATGDGGCQITVSDSGQGIAAEHLPHLFDRFYQVDGSRTRKGAGNGIGLALVKELVDLHEGSIGVTSEVGRGTAFVIQLPLLEGEGTTAPEAEGASVLGDIEGYTQSTGAAPAPEAAPELPGEDEALVLIVEDNADLRDYIRSHLSGLFTIAEAANGIDGLAQARDLVPDLVITDVMMPEMDGLDLSRALRDDERTSHIPLVFLTAEASDAGRLAGLETGAAAYLTKPFDATELRLQVGNLIEGRRQMQRKFRGQLGAAPLDLPTRESVFLERVERIVNENLASSLFGVDRLAEEAGMSRRQLLRKLRALTEETPIALIRRMRLERAAQYLDAGTAVKDVAHQTGFESVPYFSRVFRQAYGRPPSAYRDASRAERLPSK
jgi:signal transduction histidine kinase/ligand-binding sensor domain-containing protein/CheY-like chemotaxis protein